MKYVFIDTNIFMHMKPLSQMDFKRLFGDFELRVLVAQIVLRELDEKKNQPIPNKMKDRVRNALKMIEQSADEPVHLGGRASLELCRKIPRLSFEHLNLDKGWGDHVLIATAYEFSAEHPEDEVILFSDDTGAKLNAHMAGLQCIKPPEDYKLPSAEDEAAAEIRNLKKQLQKAQSSMPKLAFGFSDECAQIHKFTLGVETNDFGSFYSRIRREAEQALPVLSKEEIKKNPAFIVAAAFSNIPDGEYDRYMSERDVYFSQLEEYARELFEIDQRRERSFVFQLSLKNDGTAPAKDADIHIHFPDGFELFEEDDDAFASQVEAPREPRKPKSHFEMLSYDFTDFNRYMAPPVLNTKGLWSSLSIKKSNSYDVKDHFKILKHGMSYKVADFLIVFDSWADVKSFSASYTVNVANMPEPLCGTINFKHC